jgi:hypothetical protein
MISEFEGVGQQVNEDLAQSLLVTDDLSAPQEVIDLKGLN